MPKYQTKYTHHGLTYTEIKRHNNICLFEGIAPSGRKEYEIHVLRDKLAHFKSADAGTTILSSPSTSEWGKYGYTFMTKEKAIAKWNSLVEVAAQNTGSLSLPSLVDAS